MSRLRAALALGLGLTLTAAACGQQTLDVAEVESTIGQRLTRDAKQKVTVRCPEEVKIKKGDSFDCSATGKRGKTTVTVTQLDDNGRVRGVVKEP
jgi:hypothetical protein